METAIDERRVRAIGRALFDGMAGEKPALYDTSWTGQILERAMGDEAFKTEMFRFVDVYPVLGDPAEVYRHVQEYLLRPGLEVPAVIRLALKGAGLGRLARHIAAGQIAKNLERMARRFILGVNGTEALPTLRALRQAGQAFTLDLLGEATVSDAESDGYAARYGELVETLAADAAGWPADPRLDSDALGPIPRVNVSVKVSSLESQLDPLAFERSVARAAGRLIPLFRRARALGVFLNLDMEQVAYRDLTLSLFERVMADPELSDVEHAGVVIQAYLRDAEADARRVIAWAKRTGRRITVRLVKGAYWDYEIVRAAQQGWPVPVWRRKSATDACFERVAALLIGAWPHVRTAVASHNVRSIAHALACAEAAGVPQNGIEIQGLYGMAEPIRSACVGAGYRVRVYAPVGELIPGMGYLVRRLLENTSNDSWLRQGFAESRDPDEMLGAPSPDDPGPSLSGPQRAPAQGGLPSSPSATAPEPFRNEPLRDFSLAAVRDAFDAAIARVDRSLGAAVGPVIDGRRVATERTLDRLDPADGRTILGRVGLATPADADRAVAIANTAFPGWRDTPVDVRAGRVMALAAALRAHRDELSALALREVGKPRREADADVAEAIDFCEYYGRRWLELGRPRLTQHVLGETNHALLQPRGVAVVIAPWNFPVAILTGMAAAALVTGNAVILKPAEQSSLVAARVHALALEAGIPPGVFHFLPGIGEEVGAHLVAHRDVATVAFTGSLAVGLHIWRQAGITHPGQPRLKRVICEMGGKNAIIVDSDADLDEAVHGVVTSAFGYAGQKCSACSRVIVLGQHHDTFVERLVEATRSLTVGPPLDPATQVGPVVDDEAYQRIRRVVQDGEQRAHKLVGDPMDGPGYYVAPTVFDDVAPTDPLARDEIFGPVLCVLRAERFEQAIDLALETPYALTGGVYSRSPAHIAMARERFRVGNLYINRSITGALVERQPFGGFGMSGGGTKAGGADYLAHFCDPRVITENTLRRGFAPEAD